MKFVYKLTDCNNLVYFGSGCGINEKKRYSKHINKHNLTVSRKMDISSLKMEILEQYDDDDITDDELLWKERYYFDKYDCINKNRPISTEEEKKQHKNDMSKEHYKNNKKRILEYQVQYQKTYRLKHLDELPERRVYLRHYMYWKRNDKLFNIIKPLFYDI